ncbi:MAG: hypothetical protein NTW64_02175, partial [Candidatus Omnitrophica bacterium]|nr:hypothetical protein [Candidatus Omnitrophota bacterium]
MGKGKKSEKIQINPTLPEFSKDKNSGEWTVSFSIECGNNLSYEIKYRFPEGPILESSDFLIPVCLIPAMKNQKILKIPGKVSKQLIQNVSIIQDIFRWWYSDYSIVKIETEEESQNQPQPSKRVACFFSLGVDSSYTLLKHLDEIGTLIFILGYDKKLTEETRLELSNTVKGIASSLRKNLIIVETNLRNFSNLYTDWGAEYYGAFLASVALLLSPQFKKIYIASAHTYKDLSAWGSHPILDQYWSNGLVQIAHDG